MCQRESSQSHGRVLRERGSLREMKKVGGGPRLRPMGEYVQVGLMTPSETSRFGRRALRWKMGRICLLQ